VEQLGVLLWRGEAAASDGCLGAEEKATPRPRFSPEPGAPFAFFCHREIAQSWIPIRLLKMHNQEGLSGPPASKAGPFQITRVQHPALFAPHGRMVGYLPPKDASQALYVYVVLPSHCKR
jgi:hypothetical protein